MLSSTPNRYSNRHSKICTNLCTIVTHFSPITMISPSHEESILLKTFGPQKEKWPVAPNVAGSIPVSHPNLPEQFLPVLLLPTEHCLNFVFGESAVCCKQRHIFQTGLGDEHTVERVAVMRREFAYHQRMEVRDLQGSHGQ